MVHPASGELIQISKLVKKVAFKIIPDPQKGPILIESHMRLKSMGVKGQKEFVKNHERPVVLFSQWNLSPYHLTETDTRSFFPDRKTLLKSGTV